ncbi:HFR081Wp [Eremothecium sinecaudum]|uniref:HFR081Wp n=1 Tax=Eremothecium sinecaudum TaxID=45286 RepID=A0A0X8HUV1_9SACH|nr:HFR081Wp [Eremothecium sinecaudum]AMD21936.1 HFR081Wp [Eremothecium sinecaudum]
MDSNFRLPSISHILTQIPAAGNSAGTQQQQLLQQQQPQQDQQRLLRHPGIIPIPQCIPVQHLPAQRTALQYTFKPSLHLQKDHTSSPIMHTKVLPMSPSSPLTPPPTAAAANGGSFISSDAGGVSSAKVKNASLPAATDVNAGHDHHSNRASSCKCNQDHKHQRKVHKQSHIPRPRNAFILFRQHWHQQLFPQERIKQSERGNGSFKTNSQVSVDIGQRWRSLSAEDRQHWLDLAKKEKEEHMKKYPNYKYVPNRREKKGTSSNAATTDNIYDDVKSSCGTCHHKEDDC